MIYSTALTGSEKLRLGCAIALSNENGEVLLEKRSDCSLWGSVGGSMNVGEIPHEAATREFFEETGISLDPKQLNLLGVYGNVLDSRIVVYPDNRWHQVDIVYLSMSNRTYLPTASKESLDVKYFAIPTLDFASVVPTSIKPILDFQSFYKLLL